MNLIQSTILTSLPAGRKKTPSGWTSFNAPCCVHNGESQDKKKRGGIMTTADGTPSGWTSFNAPCCVHNGESQDKKKRGGIMTTADITVSIVVIKHHT
jgi:hypothetical protein